MSIIEEAKMSETVKIIYVGNKPIGNYLEACSIARQNGVRDLVFKARGKNILRCIDVVSILQRNGGIMNSVEIGSQRIPDRHGYVSTIEISVEL